ncbi:MAG: hypothetical protein HC803_09835, partial [Saprospiraceae bacterium]|nr:hypothetical protein [Saprospiraceae bacterium]
APIANFSQCHVGIIGHLDALDGLPALMAPAQRARQVATDMLAFFDAVILEHHNEEERELVPRRHEKRRPRASKVPRTRIRMEWVFIAENF